MRIIIIFLFFININLFAQNKDYKKYDKALYYYQNSQLIKAKDILIKLSKKNSIWDKPQLLLASIYKDEFDFEMAEKSLLNVFDLKSKDDINGVFQIATMFYENGLYEKALKYFNISCFLDNDFCLTKAKFFIDCCEFAINSKNSPKNFKPINLGSNINSLLSENGPAITADNSKILFTRRILNNNKFSQEDLFYSERNNSSWSIAKPFTNLNSNLNEGALSFSCDKSMLVFTICNKDDAIGSCDLYFSSSKSNFNEIINCGNLINSKYWEAQGCFSADGKYLYFISNRPGGYGGTDIWYSEINDNSFGKPVNAGPIINTNKDEMSPFLHSDNKTLYFASKGHVGMGNFDIFLSRRSNVKSHWDEPINLGYPINNYLDQNSLVVSNNGKTAFFASDFDGFGKEDIFTFELDESIKANKLNDLEIKIISSQNGDEIVLEDINFLNNSFSLDTISFYSLNILAKYLIDNNNIRILIEGHTNNIGSSSENQILSEMRSKSVYDYLIFKNVKSLQLSYIGFGELRPLYSNDNELGRFKNRRTSFRIQ